MEYLLLFLEGIITFISPCMLPMLPIYISFFAGGSENSFTEKNTTKEKFPNKAFTNSLGFVLGFTLVFISLGAFAGTVGQLLSQYGTIFNLVCGGLLILFGLNYLGIFKIFFLNKTYRINTSIRNVNFFSSILFGFIFSIGWTPCVGAFLGSALMLASQSNSALRGILMLLVYSLGLGIPFVISALLIERLKSAFGFIKRHYSIVNGISGGLLILLGILIITGHMNYFLSLLTF